MLDERSSPPSGGVPPVERRVELRPKSGEAPFDLKEVFFSRTDARGVIQAGNYVFRRVADYDWSDLMGAPHRLIRHEDMPKGVFWLMWKTIQDGVPIGAYVKNKARDGLHYWVFASVVPCEDGYLSSRIKPVGPLRDVVEAEYAALRKLEQEEGLSPEESGLALLARLKDLGFPDYNRFEAHAFSEELLARQRGLGQIEDGGILRHRRMLEAADNLKTATDALIREFEVVRIVPNNMRVMASRLETTGGPFTALSGDYGAMSTEISQWFEHHVVGEKSNFATISTSVNNSMFLGGVSKIIDECHIALQGDRRLPDGMNMDAERARLSALSAQYHEDSRRGRAAVAEEARRILDSCNQMRRHVLGLSTTRVLCKIESARMGATGEGLDDIIGQLGRFQDRVAERLTRIEDLSGQIRTLAEQESTP